MPGIKYHPNANTTVHIRKIIKESNEPILSLAKRFNLTKTTVSKWKHREDFTDKSSRPHQIRAAFSPLEEWIICEIRRSTGLGINSLAEVLKPFIPQVSRNNINRCLNRYGIIEEERRQKEALKQKRLVGKFEECVPGYIHVDVKWLPKLPGESERKVLFVAIDRATRLVYIAIKDKKDAYNAEAFLKELIQFYPYKICIVLTDNGKEFTDRFCRTRKEASGRHVFDKRCKIEGIEHRLTRPYTPQTNGLVERFNGRIEEILKQHHFNTYSQLMETLNKYLRCYNFINKQRVLNNKSPSAVVLDWYQKDKSIFKDSFNPSSYNLPSPNN